MCGLSLAWVTSENSTSTSNADILSRSSSLDPILSPTVSGVQCWLALSVVPRQPSAARLSAVQRQLLSSGSPVNSLSRPLPTSGYGEISGPRILCLVSRQNRQMNRLLWQPTHIVLQLCLMVYQPLWVLKEKQQWYYLNHGLRNKEVHTFPKGNVGKWTHLVIQKILFDFSINSLNSILIYHFNDSC